MFLGLFLLALVPALTYPLITLSCFMILNQRTAELERLVRGTTLQKHMKPYGGMDAEDGLAELFRHYHKPNAYILPVLLNMSVAFAVALAVLVGQGALPITPPALLAYAGGITGPALAGFVGAYLWGHFDLIRRVAASDLSPTPFYYLWLRLLVGGVGGYVMGLTVQPPADVLLALGIGAFPLESIRAYAEGQVRQRLQLQGAAPRTSDLNQLQGATPEVIERLAEEGIRSAQHLALANPMRFLLKTNFDWTTILDMMDQAMLFVYVGERIAQLRPIAVRSAIEVVEIGEMLDSEDPGVRGRGEALVSLLAQKLEEDEAGVRKLIDTIRLDAQVQFVSRLWTEAFSTEEEEGVVKIELRRGLEPVAPA